MKYTIEQLKDKTDAELNLIAFLAQGWNDHNFDLPNYTPTTNKEQMVDLMVKYGLLVSIDETVTLVAGDYCGEVIDDDDGESGFTLEDKSPLRAVTIASILAAQEGK